MTQKEAFNLFEQMIFAAREELVSFTKNQEIHSEQKIDKSFVTNCDKAIDKRLSNIATENNLLVVSEEAENELDIVKGGNYITIDPIDGTLGYMEYVNEAISKGDVNNFISIDKGPASDFCLLLGIVEDKVPRFGACYNYVTGEKILIDSSDKNSLIRENNFRNYTGTNGIYVDQRPGGDLENELINLSDVTVFKQAALGLKSVYTVINPHSSAITLHTVQTSGLWDIMPAAVAAKCFGGSVYDANAEELKLDSYIILPGKGAIITKGDKFNFVLDKIRQA